MCMCNKEGSAAIRLPLSIVVTSRSHLYKATAIKTIITRRSDEILI